MKFLFNKTLLFFFILILTGLGCKTVEETKYPDVSGSWEIDIKWEKEVIGMPNWQHNMKNVENASAQFTANESNFTAVFNTSGTGFFQNSLNTTGTISLDGDFVLSTKVEKTEKKTHQVVDIRLVGKITDAKQFRGAQITFSFTVTFKGKPFMKGTIKGTMDGDKINRNKG